MAQSCMLYCTIISMFMHMTLHIISHISHIVACILKINAQNNMHHTYLDVLGADTVALSASVQVVQPTLHQVVHWQVPPRPPRSDVRKSAPPGLPGPARLSRTGQDRQLSLRHPQAQGAGRRMNSTQLFLRKTDLWACAGDAPLPTVNRVGERGRRRGARGADFCARSPRRSSESAVRVIRPSQPSESAVSLG
jgi:hypothetical protein